MGFRFPSPPEYKEEPIWTGNGFMIGSEFVPILKYSICDTGWNSELTDFHEMEADQGNHYIDRASRYHACMQIRKCLDGGTLLEIGSSSGYLLRELKGKFPKEFIVGSDCISEPLEKIFKIRGDIPLIQYDLVNCPLPDNCLDVVVALNVLEHIEDDVCALQQIYRILKPGGTAIIEVPAGPDLFDFYDEELKHFRRYSIDDLSQKAMEAGFFIQRASHLGFFLYPAFRYIKQKNKVRIHSKMANNQDLIKKRIKMGGKMANHFLYGILKIEIYFGRLFQYPIGIRCIITLKKDFKT